MSGLDLASTPLLRVLLQDAANMQVIGATAGAYSAGRQALLDLAAALGLNRRIIEDAVLACEGRSDFDAAHHDGRIVEVRP